MPFGKQWTDAEKVDLLFSIIESKGGTTVNWNNVKIPEGRTVKSCMHVIDALKKMRNNGEGNTTLSHTTTPKNTSGKGKRKNNKTAEDTGMGSDDEETAKQAEPKSKRQRTGTKVKKEESPDK